MTACDRVRRDRGGAPLQLLALIARPARREVGRGPARRRPSRVSPIVAPFPAGAPPIETQVALQLVVDATGSVESAVEISRVPRDAPDAFARAAIDAVKAAKFAPSSRDGRPIRSRIEYVVVFHPPPRRRARRTRDRRPRPRARPRRPTRDRRPRPERERPRPRHRLVVAPRPRRHPRRPRDAHRLAAPADERDALGRARLLRRPRGRRGARQRRLPPRLRPRQRLGHRDEGRRGPHQHPAPHPRAGLRRRQLHHPRGRPEHPRARRARTIRARATRPSWGARSSTSASPSAATSSRPPTARSARRGIVGIAAPKEASDETFAAFSLRETQGFGQDRASKSASVNAQYGVDLGRQRPPAPPGDRLRRERRLSPASCGRTT